MKILIVPIVAILCSWSFSSCKSSGKPTFCDTACISEPIKFQHTTFDSPYVMIKLKDCTPDSVIWSHNMIPNKLKQSFGELIKVKKPRLNKNFVSCYFNDTSYAWLKFNDCVTGRGYLIKLPYSKSEKWSIYTSSLNNFDPKFNIEEGLIAYYDETFIWVQDMATGKRGKMLMNEKVMEIDHDNVHKSIDSLNVSRNKVWANLQIDGKWTVKEKAITLE